MKLEIDTLGGISTSMCTWIRTHFRLYDLYLFPVAQGPQNFSYFLPFFLVEYLSPVLWCKYYVIFAIPFCM